LKDEIAKKKYQRKKNLNPIYLDLSKSSSAMALDMPMRIGSNFFFLRGGQHAFKKKQATKKRHNMCCLLLQESDRHHGCWEIKDEIFWIQK
jgi:hypothetical protein